MTQHPDDVKVLFLAGKGRSGGTLLASLLGQLPGFFNIGELNRLWDWGLVSNHRCGCGRPVQACPTWNAILEDADALLAGTDLVPLASARIDLAQAAVVRWPSVLKLLAAKPGVHPRWPELDRYTLASSAVYRSIIKLTGARVIIDSSRLPIEPIGLGLVPGVDVRVAQVIRDPRAVVYSWRRSRLLTDRDVEEYMPKFSASYSTLSWTARNLVVEAIRRRGPVPTIQYDEIARDPAAVLRRLADFVGEPAGDMEFLTSAHATLAPTHSVGGNPVRMTSGAITIEPDEEWRHAISGRDRTVGTLLALPLLRRYGLPVRSASSAAASSPAPSDPAPAPAPAPGGGHGLPTLTTNAWLRFDAIRHNLRIAAPSTVLEIGAGEGGIGAWLASRFDYRGVEPDADSRATARARIEAAGRGEMVGDLDDLDGQRFDLACAFEVLEHIEDDVHALEQWREFIQPAGWLLLSVPAHQDRFSPRDELVGHYRRYERDGLTERLEATGFSVVRFSSYGAGLGNALERLRDIMARRAGRQVTESGSAEERSEGSGRYLQPKKRIAGLVYASVAAPGRLLQTPFARTDIGTGYVVLARRSA
jgi:SAM-dependent methyltransferase